ncbi:LysR family transcriptional regulator [Cognatiyoonia sp. IB215446]|uniref:LysR family transcriptional regulator n=1 Tax=Cognatiyoonia sp. IB215446 TaxID=3097355 RepID=UPI002A0E69DF|nr:LysR family transcriptional regulator [Cognatiyoonia sp. IB215446]MDX8350279.1 LysR family transcriptional regulator [Cognatiyoonia sp. IB215446]
MRDWEQMPFFLAVARSGSLRSAAEQLGATHATVRRHVEALEATYGVQLFRRSRKGLTLTAAGETLMPEAQEAERLLARARNGLQGLDREASGKIRLSVDPMTGHLLLAPVFAEFGRIYPQIDLEISLTYDIESVSRMETDIAIRHAAEIKDDVVARKLAPLSLSIFASRDYVETHFDKAGRKGEGLSFISYGPVPELMAWVARSPFPAARLRHQVTDPEMHLHLARAGAGMAFLPLWCAQKFPELQRMPGAEVDESRNTWVVMHEDLRRIRRVRIFVDFLAQALVAMGRSLR